MSKKPKLLMGFILFLLVPISSKADSEMGLQSIDDYIRMTLSQSASLESAYESYRAATARAPQVSALPDPKMSYGYFLKSVETRVGPQRHRIGLSQSFPWFGTLSLREDMSNAEARAELARFTALKNELVFRVCEAYAEIAYIEQAIAITSDMMNLVQSWESVLRERFRTATGAHSDLIRVQLELGKLEDRLLELKDQLRPLRVAMNSLLNREADASVSISPEYLSANATGNSVTVAFKEVQKGNPELQMLDAVIEARNSGIQLAEKKFYPNFSIGVDYVVTGDRDVPGGGDDAVLGMVAIDIPLYWEKNNAALLEANSRMKSIERMKKDKEFQLRSEFSRAQYELRDADRKLILYEKTLIPKTRESIEASYTAYEAGDSGFLDVIDSEERLLEFRLTQRRAQANKIIATAKLQRLSGGFSQLASTMEVSDEQ